MTTREQAYIFLRDEAEQELPRRFKKKQPPSVQSEQKKYFDELRDKIGDDKFYEMECNYQEYLRLKTDDE